MIEKVKAAAFPLLLAIVAWFGQDLVRRTVEIQQQQQELLVELAKVQVQIAETERRVSNLEKEDSDD